jgi:predicted metal-dependent phosphoesterase TrpH
MTPPAPAADGVSGAPPGASAPGVMKTDLHVHSHHSGFTRTLRLFRSRDCYSSPEAVYRRARARGMDLVTITDHDSIDGCLELLERHPDAPDILVGEEIECRVPGSGIRLHLGAFGLTERQHRDLQPLRANVFELAGFLRAEGVALVLHHPFHFFRGETAARPYIESLLPLVHAVEVRNATMLPEHNELAAAIVRSWNEAGRTPRLGVTGGSDAHVLGHVAAACTVVPGRTRDEFLEGLKRGRSAAAGAHGTTGRLAFEIYGVICNYWGALLGARPSGLGARERASGIACSLLSLPFQFSPFLVTVAQKRGERRRVALWQREWPGGRRTVP